MKLFTAAHDRKLVCDALLVDTDRTLRPLAATLDESEGSVTELLACVLDRVVLMGRSLHAVRDRTFCVFAGRRQQGWHVALTEPYHAGVIDALKDALRDFGAVTQLIDIAAHASDLAPWLAFQSGVVTVLNTPTLRPYNKLAARHGLRVAAAATTHAPDADVYVGPVAARDYVAHPEELTLDLERLDAMPPDEWDHLFTRRSQGPNPS